MKHAKPDPAAWAKSRTPTPEQEAHASRQVESARVRAWIPLWRAGTITVSIAQAADWLNANTPWKGAVGTFRRCLKEHHGFSTCG